MKLLQITILVFVISMTHGQTNLDQSIIPPSPNSMAMMRQANLPVDEYTGTARINIPIYSIPSNSINIPVSLDYRATGIRVQDIASNVGLGWNLSAGGRITRVVRHLPDYSKPRCGDPVTGSDINVALAEACDSELDIYYYTILGRSGKFYLDPSNNIIFPAPANDMRFSYSTFSESFSIYDERGYRYTFSPNAEITRIYSSNELGGTAYQRTGNRSSNASKYEFKYEFKSSWVLTSIRSPSGRSIATFQYQTSNVEYENYSERIKFDDLGGQGEQRFTDTKLEVRQLNLTGIQTDFGTITFQYEPGRTDLFGGRRLSLITIKDHLGSTFKTYELNHTYYNKYQVYNGSASSVNCGSDFDCNRLLLSGITEGGVPVYTFDYEDNSTYIFPRRYSPHIDHWGYSNARFDMYAQNRSHPGYVSAIPSVGSWAGPSVIGAVKSHNLEATKVLSLKQVNLATGGHQRFVYESHGEGIGGLRIKEIWVSEGSKEWLDIAYTYSGPYSIGTPIYHYSPYNSQYIAKSIMLKQQYDLDGRAIGYSTVRKTFTDGSYIINTYSNQERPDGDPVNSVASVRGVSFDGFYHTGMSANGPPFTSKTSYSWERGILKKSEWYDSNGSLVKSLENVPDYSSPLVLDQDCFVADQGHEIGINSTVFKWVNLGQYKVVTKHFSISKSTVTHHDQSNPIKKTSVVTTYTYHPDYKTLPASKLEELADGSELKTTYKYPFDFETTNTSDTRVKALAKMNGFLGQVLSVPIETVIYRKKNGGNFKVIAAHLQTFRLYEGTTGEGTSYESALPYELYELRLQDADLNFASASVNMSTGNLVWDSKYKKVQEFEYDPITENLLKVQDEPGIEQEFQYDTHGYLTASISNPAGNSIREDYKYQNLNVSRVTDVNSKYTDYTYDSRNRLKLVKDKDANIVQRYRYNYGGVTGLNSDFTISGTRAINMTLTFETVEDTPIIGENTYYWDFGDGTVMKNSLNNVSHTYTSSGVFNVTLVVSNPEFESAFSSRQITISPSLTVSPADITFPYYAESKTMNVTSFAGPFVVSGDGGWLTISNVTNDSFVINVSPVPTDGYSRSRTIIVSNFTSNVEVLVTQEKHPLYWPCPDGCHWDVHLQDCILDNIGGSCSY